MGGLSWLRSNYEVDLEVSRWAPVMQTAHDNRPTLEEKI